MTANQLLEPRHTEDSEVPLVMGCNLTVLRHNPCDPANMVSAGGADEITEIPVRTPNVLVFLAQTQL